MAKILGSKPGKLSLGESFGIAGAKIVSEQLLGRFVGNSSIISGASKILGAMGVNKFIGGKTSDILGTAMTVDGTEDIIMAVVPDNFLSSPFSSVKENVQLV